MDALILNSVLTLLGGGGLGWLANWSVNRTRTRLDVVAQAQQIIATMQADCSDKTRQIRLLNEEVCSLLKRQHDCELRYTHSRCDLTDCPDRQPPFAWQRPG